MLPIRAILFDADGVLQHSGGSDLAARLERIQGSAPTDLDAFTRAVFAAEQPALLGQADFAEQLVPLVAPWGARDVADRNVAAARGAGLHAASFVHPRSSGAREEMVALLARFSVHVAG